MDETSPCGDASVKRITHYGGVTIADSILFKAEGRLASAMAQDPKENCDFAPVIGCYSERK